MTSRSGVLSSDVRVAVTWLALTDDPDATLAERGYVVTGTERGRAERYHRRADRARSLLAAGLLRDVVARHARVNPAEVAVDRRCVTCGEQHGRPVVGLPGTPPPHVSVTHAGSWVGVAVSARAPVGLDVERRDAVGPDLAATVAAPGERTDDLVRFWVAKEAALKATGHGLTVEPSTVVLDARAARVRSWPLADDPARTHIRRVDPDEVHAAAVCVIGSRDLDPAVVVEPAR